MSPVKERMVGLILRHGSTELNEQKCFRSWLDIPLSKEGIEQAHAAARFLKKYAIRNVICSPLLRAFVTADICSNGLPVYQHRGLFPWRLGIFSGLSKEDNDPALRVFVKNPEVCIPGGESLNDFEERQFAFWQQALKVAQKEGLTLYVAHTSNVTALVNFTEGAEETEPELGDSVKPGGIGAIYFDGSRHRVEPIFGIPEEAKFGGS